jgi:hypothetical protein
LIDAVQRCSSSAIQLDKRQQWQTKIDLYSAGPVSNIVPAVKKDDPTASHLAST